MFSSGLRSTAAHCLGWESSRGHRRPSVLGLGGYFHETSALMVPLDVSNVIVGLGEMQESQRRLKLGLPWQTGARRSSRLSDLCQKWLSTGETQD